MRRGNLADVPSCQGEEAGRQAPRRTCGQVVLALHVREVLGSSRSSFSCAFCLPIMAGICLRRCPMMRQWILAARTRFTNSFTCAQQPQSGCEPRYRA